MRSHPDQVDSAGRSLDEIVDATSASETRAPRLLVISQSYAPDTTPTAIRASKLLERLSSHWDITVLTESEGPTPGEQAEGARARAGVRVNVVPSRRPRRLFALLRRLRLAKLIELAVWPDESIFWVPAAIRAGRRVARGTSPSAIVVFMMPYSSGLAGLALSRMLDLPLVLNLDDSPTCTDMHPTFPTRLHYRLARMLEDRYARRADAIVYVSQTNLEATRSRLPARAAERFHLVRYGAEPPSRYAPLDDGRFRIAYVGAMSGWWSLIRQGTPRGRLRRLHDHWARLGRYERTTLDERTSSPAFIGEAIIDAIAEHPSWAGRVTLTIQGNPYPEWVVVRALECAGVESVVEVTGPVPHQQVAELIARVDLLFLTLPARVDGSRGGRISAKTYEYLATDRPILAAVPRGENWDYLEGKPGTWLVEPHDRRAMQAVVSELAAAKFSGEPRTFDRATLRRELSYETRAAEFASAIEAAIAHHEDAAHAAQAVRSARPRSPT